MANDRKVANLFVSMRADLGQLKLDVAEMNRTFTSGFAGIKSAAASLGGALIGAFSVQALLGFGRSALALADQLQNLSDQTKISVQLLSGVKSVLEEAGTSMDAFAKGVFNLQKNLGNVDDDNNKVALSLKRLGLSLNELRNATPDEFIKKVTDALAKISNPVERNTILFNLLGKSAKELGPAFEALTGKIDEYKKSGLRAEDVKVLDDFGDGLTRLTNKFQLIMVTGISVVIRGLQEFRRGLKLADLEIKQGGAGANLGGAGGAIAGSLLPDKPIDNLFQGLDKATKGAKIAKDTGVEDFFAGLQKQIEAIDNDFIKLRDGDKIAKEIALDLQLADFNQKRVAEGKPIASIAEFRKYKDAILEATDALEKLNFERAQLAGAVRAETLQKGPQEDTRGLLNFAELQQAQEALDKIKLNSIDAKEKLKELGQQLSIDAIDTRQTAGKEQQRVAGITVEFIKVAKQIEQIGFTAGASQEEIASNVALAWEGAFKKIRDGAELTDAAKALNNVTNGIENAFNQTLQGVLQGTQTWGEAMKNLMGNIGASIANELTKAFILNPLFDALLGGRDTSGNRSGGLLGGAATGIGNFISSLFPTADDGLVIPGRLGAPQMVLAHGGETILPTHKASFFGQGGGDTYNIDARGAQRGVSIEIRQAIEMAKMEAIKAAPGATLAEKRRSSNFAKGLR